MRHKPLGAVTTDEGDLRRRIGSGRPLGICAPHDAAEQLPLDMAREAPRLVVLDGRLPPVDARLDASSPLPNLDAIQRALSAMGVRHALLPDARVRAATRAK